MHTCTCIVWWECFARKILLPNLTVKHCGKISHFAMSHNRYCIARQIYEVHNFHGFRKFVSYHENLAPQNFQLNCSGVCGMVWKQKDSYPTFALLCGRQEQRCSLLLFQSEHLQFPGGAFISSFDVHCFGECPLSWGR